MTLKTSLIISGDSSGASTAVRELSANVVVLNAGTLDTATALGKLNQSQAGTAASARPAGTAISQLSEAQRASAISARALAQSTDLANMAAESAAKAHRAYVQEVVQAAAKSDALRAANDQVEASSVAASSGADIHKQALAGLQGEIGAIVASVASGSSVFDAMAAHGNDIAAALQVVADASGRAATGIDATGSSGEKAGVDLSGLGDTVVDVAGKTEGMGGKLGSVAAILGGPWGAAIGIGINLLGGFVSGLVEASQESGELSAQSLSVADALSKQHYGTVQATKAISDYNAQAKQQRQNTALMREETLRAADAQVIAAISTRKHTNELIAQAQAAISSNLARGGTAAEVGAAAAITRLETLRAKLAAGEANLASLQQTRRNKLIETASDYAKAAVDPMERINQQYDRMRQKAEKAAEADTKKAENLGKTFAQIERNRAAALKTLEPAKPTPTPAATTARSTRAASPTTSARNPAIDAAAEAQRQLARDLEQVTARYLPAAAAAKDYADELARIDKLAAAYDPKKQAGLSAEQATAARAALKEASDKRLADLAMTPETKAADAARKSIDGVVQSLGAELAARKTLDPVQRAMIQHQDELAKLTGVERTAREAALRSKYEESEAYTAIEAATRSAAAAQQQFRDMALDAFDAVVIGGENAGKVVEQLAKRIASAAIEATVLKTGPLAALLKGGAPAAATAAPIAAAVAGTGAQAVADQIGKATGKTVGERIEAIFGKGNGANVLKNAGIGYTAASATGGSGVLGSAAGIVGGELGKKFLGSALGSLGGIAGPLGSIVGGVLGGVVGKLFTKAQYGTASVSSSGGNASVGIGGNASGAKSAASALGNAVNDGVARIAEQLGGELGSYNVSIGTYKDKYRVSTTGYAGRLGNQGKNNDRLGIVDFGTDGQAEAIAFAIQDAIKDGAVKGLSAAVQKALQSSSDVNKAVAEATKVQSLETLMGGLQGEIDKAFRDFAATAKERVRLAQAYGFDIVAIEKRNGEDRLKLVEQLTNNQVGSLKKLVEEMQQGALFEGSALDRIKALDTAITTAKSNLDAGVDGAGDTLANLYQQRLAASKEAYGTTGGYAADRIATINAANAAIAAANTRIASAQTKTASDPALVTTNTTLDEMANQNARMIAVLERTEELLKRAGLVESALSARTIQLARA